MNTEKKMKELTDKKETICKEVKETDDEISKLKAEIKKLEKDIEEKGID